ncbi:Tn3 family transposase [Holosporaceae bacterium 'Namur']|nr:Tn3 family transposase [Holosporaceae bacterium 'Namur']
MQKSKRLVVFSEVEKCAFYGLPDFDDNKRKQYFTFSEEELSVVMKDKRMYINVFCAIQMGHFKAKKIFFQIKWKDIKKEDLNFILNAYFIKQKFAMRKVSEYDYYVQRRNIIAIFDYRLWSAKFTPTITTHVKKIIRCDISPNFIGRELITFLRNIKVVIPGYSTLQTIITQNLRDERKRISCILDKMLGSDDKVAINKLITTEENISKLAALKQDAKNFGFKMMLKERQKHSMLQSIYSIAKNIIKELDISNQNIKYYSDLTIYYNAGKLRNLGYNQNYLYILCYVLRRYQEINDNLIEAFKYTSKKIDDDIKAKVKKKFLEEKSGIEKKMGRLLLLYVNEKIGDTILFGKVRKRAFRIMTKEKMQNLGNKLLKRAQHKKEFYWQEVDRLQKTYQKNLRPLFTKLCFSSEDSRNTWLLSVKWLQNTLNSKDNNIDDDQIASISKHLDKYLLKERDNIKVIDINRYEYWLYRQIEEKVNAGSLYIENSILHRCFNHELISCEEKQEVLKDLDIPWLRESAEKQINDLLATLDNLWVTINQRFEQGKLKHLKYDEKKQRFTWSRVRAISDEELQNKFYSQLPFCEINDVMRFVDEQCDCLSVFTPLQQRYTKQEIVSKERLIASILSKALNYGDYKMSQASDISYQALKTTSSQVLRLSKLREANDIISNEVAKLSIFPYYSIDLELLFSGVDGQKYELDVPNIKARFSRKYLREKQGLSAYTILTNNIPFNCYLIGSHEHESYHVFDIWYNNTSDIMPQVITGDMHSINKANFALLSWFGVQFKPRFTNLNAQLRNTYCGKDIKEYENYSLKPTGQIDSQIIIKQKEKIDQIIATLALKEINQANLVKKLCNLPAENSLRKAVFEFDKLVRSIYTLEYMMDIQLQRDVHKSQNRIEAYHQLRAAIAKVGGKKKLYGKTDIDIEISNQCGRLVANTVIYYNSVILSGLLEEHHELKNNKKFLNIIKKISPIAWGHIHFLGQYTFKNKEQSIDLVEILKNIKLEFE